MKLAVPLAQPSFSPKDTHAILPVSLYLKDGTLFFLVNAAKSDLRIYWVKSIPGQLVITAGKSTPARTPLNQLDGARLSIVPGEYTWEVRETNDRVVLGPSHFDVKHSEGKGAGLTSLKNILHGSGRIPAAVEFLD